MSSKHRFDQIIELIIFSKIYKLNNAFAYHYYIQVNFYGRNAFDQYTICKNVNDWRFY